MADFDWKRFGEVMMNNDGCHYIHADLPQNRDIIRLSYPDRLYIKDEQGAVHTYSLTELLDGLVRLARNSNKRAKKDKK